MLRASSSTGQSTSLITRRLRVRISWGPQLITGQNSLYLVVLGNYKHSLVAQRQSTRLLSDRSGFRNSPKEQHSPVAITGQSIRLLIGGLQVRILSGEQHCDTQWKRAQPHMLRQVGSTPTIATKHPHSSRDQNVAFLKLRYRFESYWGYNMHPQLNGLEHTVTARKVVSSNLTGCSKCPHGVMDQHISLLKKQSKFESWWGY